MDLRVISAEHVKDAVALYDELGQDEFLRRYGFGWSRRYRLVVGGRTYPSKAIVGVAHEYATGSPLRSTQFTGGRGQTVPTLERLGFVVESDRIRAEDAQAYMLLWNPESYRWHDDDRLAILNEILEGGTFTRRWSIHANSTQVKIGDRAFLRRTGRQPRGIIAAGVVSGTPFTDRHWGDEKGSSATYVDIDWEAMVEPEDVLDLGEIAELYPSAAWAARSGGARIPEEAREALESAWGSHVDDVVSDYRVSAGTTPTRAQEIEARYGLTLVKTRRHQRAFRNLLLEGRPHVCEFPGCGITSVEVLQAAHIIPDSEGGKATLDNGLLLCANHHRALDSDLVRFVGDRKFDWVDGVNPF